MWKRLSDWLCKVSNGWVALFGLVGFLLFSGLVLPRQAARADLDTGGAGSPDMSFYYSADDLYQMAERYGEQGRANYIRARFTFDIIWPMVYTLFLCTAISWVYSLSFAPGSWLKRANLAPVLGALFDYLENVSTSVVMWRYPEQTAVFDIVAPLFTVAKWIFLTGSFALLLAGVLAAVWKLAKSRGWE